MAEVFLARAAGAEGIEKTLVVKRILPSIAKRSRFISMFVDEAKLATRLNHPNIVQVYAFEQVRGEFLLAMEYVDGPDISRLLARAQRKGIALPPELAVFMVAEAAKGLDYAHRRADERGQPMDIVHRDVSPQNILISHSGAVKITDFGIARARSFTEQTGVIKGKFAYMSPEQANAGPVDRRGDVYSLGAVLTELLAGRPLFDKGVRVLERVQRGEIPSPRDLNPEVPRELDDVARRAMALDPGDRFDSARDMLRALTRYLHDQHEPVDPVALEAWVDRVLPPDQRGGDRLSAVGLPPVAGALGGAASDTSEATLVSGARERRPVLLVVGQLRRPAPGADPTGLGVVERVLDDIAYKADAVLGWSDDSQALERRNFRLVLGLGTHQASEPLRAVRLALDVLDALGSISDGSEGLLCSGLGLSRGVASTARDATGRLVRYQAEDSAIELAEALARSGAVGEVLAAGEVYRLARREFAFDTQQARDVALSLGEDLTPQAVRAYPLRGARGYDDRVAQGRPGGRGATLVGRGEVVALLERSMAEAIRDASTRSLRVTGALGVGKTAVVLSALERVGGMARCLHLECGFGSARDSLSAVRQLLHVACGYGPGHMPAAVEEACRAMLGEGPVALGQAQHAARLLEGPPPTGLDDELIARTAETVGAVLSALAKERPLLVCVDALQWADEASLRVLGMLAQRPRSVPLVYWFIGRPEPEVDRCLGDIRNHALEELSREDSRSLLAASLGDAVVPPDLERAVLSRAGGNPLFLVEIAEAMIERGAVSVEQSAEGPRAVRRFRVPVVLPAALEDVVSARLQQLDEPSLNTLRWLAVVGARVGEDELTELVERPMSEPIADLIARGLLQRDAAGRLVFANAVVRQVALEGLDLRDRAGMQRRVDAALVSLRPYLREVVRGRELEHQGRSSESAQAFARAAREARRAGELHDALRYLARALWLLHADDLSRIELHARRAETLRMLGQTTRLDAEVAALVELAERTGDARARGWAFAFLALASVGRADVDQAKEQIEVAHAVEAAARDVSLSAFIGAVEGRLLVKQGQPDEGLGVLTRVLSTSEEQVAPELLAPVQLGLAKLAIGEHDWMRARRAATGALGLAYQVGDRRSEASAAEHLALACAADGDYEDALWLLRGAQARARDAGIAMGSARRLARLGQVCADGGDLNSARQYLVRAGELSVRAHEPEQFAAATLELMLLELQGFGDLPRARATLGRLEAAGGAQARDVAACRGHLAAFEENWELAQSACQTALSGAGPSERPLLLAHLATASAALGDVERARDHAIAAFDALCTDASPHGRERGHAAVQRALSAADLVELSGRCRRRGEERVQHCLERFRDSRLRELYLQSRHARVLRGLRG